MSSNSPDGAQGSTHQRFLSSTLAAYGSQLARTAIRLVVDLSLARLVLPQGHGLFDQALALVMILSLVRDLGLPYHLVRDPKAPYGTVLAWSLGSGLVLVVGTLLAAPWTARLDPGLPAVLQVLCLWLLVDALAVTPRVFFERQLQVKKLVAPEVQRSLVFASVALPLAYFGFGVWSFVAAELAAATFFAARVWARAWGELPLEVEFAQIPGLLKQSRWLFLVALAAVSLPQVAVLILGFFVTSTDVGFFNRARSWAFRLQILVLPALARVLYPALVAYQDDDERFRTAYRFGTLSILALETLAAYFLFFNAEIALLKILLGPGWEGAVPLLKILCFAPLVDPFSRLGGEVLKVRHEDRVWLFIVVLNSFSLGIFGWWLTSGLGGAGMAWAHYLLLGNLVMTWRMAVLLGPIFWRLLADLVFLYLAPLPLFLAVAAWQPEATWSRFAFSLLAAAAAAGLYAWRFHRPFRTFLRHGGEGQEEAATAEAAP
ncbi:MAG: oligosaccharide flippase family protein [Acidobacteriota bacterium]